MQDDTVEAIPPIDAAEKVRVYSQFDKQVPQLQQKTDKTGRCAPQFILCVAFSSALRLRCGTEALHRALGTYREGDRTRECEEVGGI